jgi:pimeloyl-ACP methyl ester carboxylesterase
MQHGASNLLTENNIDPILADYSSDTRDMLITFGGISGEIGVPVFEFFKMLSGFPVKKLFLRDVRQAWYQDGVPGFGNTVDEIATHLKDQIAQQGSNRVVMIGNSAGGFAALLFGCLLEVDEIITFSPQTFINQTQRLLHADFRWRPQIASVQQCSKLKKTYLDMEKVFRTRPMKTKIQIHYCAKHRLDRQHARRMRHFPNVRLHEYAQGGHLLVKLLRNDGRLTEIIRDAFPGRVGRGVDAPPSTMDRHT